jgi:hypothetical protein
MRLAQVSSRLADLSEQYEVPEKLGRVSEKVHDGVSVASEAARKGAAMAYRAALEHPRTAIGGVIIAAVLVGGALWYVFGEWRRPAAPRRRHATRVRAGAERRRKPRQARAST